MNIKSQKDFFAGLMFMVVGGSFAWGATKYTIGEGARMGPGYFPLLLGIVLALLGAFILFESLVVDTEDGEKIGSIAWKPLGFIIGANLAFGGEGRRTVYCTDSTNGQVLRAEMATAGARLHRPE